MQNFCYYGNVTKRLPLSFQVAGLTLLITTMSETLVKHAVLRKLSCVKFMIINYHSSVERIKSRFFVV